MNASVTLKQIWFNKTLSYFFFRQQAMDTFEAIVELVGVGEEKFNVLSERIEDAYSHDLDAFEEDCYNRYAEEIVCDLGYEI